MSTLAEVPQVPHGDVPLLTIVYIVAFLGFGGVSALLFAMTKNAGRAYDERWTVKLAAATLATALLAAAALILLWFAIGFIGQVVVGLGVAFALVLFGNSRVRYRR
jgi:fatty acid desaturase